VNLKGVHTSGSIISKINPKIPNNLYEKTGVRPKRRNVFSPDEIGGFQIFL